MPHIRAGGTTGIPKSRAKSLILASLRPITPPFPTPIARTNPRKRPHGRTFPVQEHHAPQGAAGCPEVEAVRQAGAGNHRRGQARDARSRDEPAAARGRSSRRARRTCPRTIIERAIKKAIGGEGENYDEIRYEGYGPGGVAVIVEALTDNRNRAASDIRSYFTKSGGNLGETGSVAFLFDRTGVIEYDARVATDDAMLDAAIEAGADDVISSESGHEIYASQETFREVAKALEAKFGEPRKAALTWKPQNTVAVDDETGEKLLKLIDLLNEHDDVQNVFANFEVSDALMAKMG